jgi:predicted nuclease of restriction endonuclease-like RecB superfamily
METGRSYDQKHAATWEDVEEEIIIKNIPKLTSETGLEGVN